jgi:tRNA modification GTPase
MIRISGNKAFYLTELLTKKEIHSWPSHTIHLSRFYEKEDIIDEGLVLKFNGPNSYTGEDTIELNCHGSPLILQKTLQSLISLGARMAAPGEFTFRAFINGKLDLAQAEAVADVINAESEKGELGYEQLQFFVKIHLNTNGKPTYSNVELKLCLDDEIGL